MQNDQIATVRESFAKVVPIADVAAELFYQRLFELDPNLRPLFKDDISEQKQKLMAALGLAVKELDNPDRLLPVIQDLGIRHIDYGVEDQHYDTVGAALLWTLDQGLGDAFTTEVETAWTEAYGTLASVMKAAAGEERARRERVKRKTDVAQQPLETEPAAESAFDREILLTEVSELSREIDQIASVAEQIDMIAKQTKMLSLNATIEAARAGDAGKGFAVVASEVKMLSNQTEDATRRVRDALASIRSRFEKLSAI